MPLREAEERLSQATGNSPPKRKDSQRRSPISGVFPNKDTAPANSPLAARHPQTMDIPGMLPVQLYLTTKLTAPERPHSAHSRASVKV
ncbi:hypothetical protein SLS59_005758 [Nothophoma quercina]|uniref:Uncharacterized protein n=1 Tax=Nothophoma quercina TaxID=749835 RepID=A0ABR3R9J9_9PLEO